MNEKIFLQRRSSCFHFGSSCHGSDWISSAESEMDKTVVNTAAETERIAAHTLLVVLTVVQPQHFTRIHSGVLLIGI